MSILDCCAERVVAVNEAESLATAVGEMHRQNVGAVVVVGSGPMASRPVGILTDRDVLKGELRLKKDLFALSVQEVMTRDPVTLPEDCEIGTGIGQLRLAGVRRAPVVNRQGDLVGLVCIDDLIPLIASELSALAAVVHRRAA